VHLQELRTAVNAVRTAAGIGVATLNDATVDSSLTIKRLHIVDLRNALIEAYVTLGLAQPGFTDSITARFTGVKAVHFQEIRTLAKGVTP
jgi:hypothetical protein